MRFALIALLFISLPSAGGAQSRAVEPGSTLTARRMLSLATLPRVEFVREWDALRKAELRRLAGDTSGAAADARLRLAFQYAQGRVMYPFFHWRETEAADIEPDPTLPAVLAALPAIDSRTWQWREVREFADAYLHELARLRLLQDPSLARGDSRRLRAEMLSLDAVHASRELWLNKATELLKGHVEDNGAYGIDEPLGWWLVRSPPPASVREVQELIAADRAHLRGKRSLQYREVAGTPLYLHVSDPPRPRRKPAPAMLWLHGGSANEGTWWHSPVTTQALLDEGVVVVAVELTTGRRFDRDSDQITDAAAAFEFLRTHANELGVDPQRLGVAGFSSGGSLALLLATRGVAPVSQGSGHSAGFPRPAAAIISGACADPLSEHEDGYFRKTMRRFGDPAQFSPFAQLRAGLPPVLAVHATEDEFCSFADMEKFARRSRSLGNEVTLVSIDGASHFFGFFHKDGQQRQRDAIAEALRRWGW